jgi:hypothetical protein
VTFSHEQFRQGLRTVRSELDAALQQNGLRDVSIYHAIYGCGPHSVVFTVATHEHTEEQEFFRETIEGSAHAIDSDAKIKVHLLVGRFVDNLGAALSVPSGATQHGVIREPQEPFIEKSL